MRHLRRAVVATAALLLAVPAPAGAAPAERLEPERLPRGAAVAVPHVEGSTIVDGTRRIDVDAGDLALLASGPSGYVVRAVGGVAREGRRILLVRRDGRERVVRRGVDVFEARVSDDGRLLAVGTLVGDGVTEVRVVRTRDGRLVASRVFGFPGGATEVVDLSGDRVLLGRSRSGRVHVWDLATDRVRQVAEAGRWLYAGDLRLGLLAAFLTGGGRCSVVARLADPDRVLWRSCRERVLSFSPDGRRVATTAIRTDPAFGTVRVVSVRTLSGRLLGRFSARSFRDVRWESGRRLLLDTVGTSTTAIVRCVADRCRAATEPRPRA